MEWERTEKSAQPIVVYGATALGTAAAVRLGERAILLEKSGWAAWEFSACFEPGEGPWEAETPEGEALKEELTRRAVLASGKTHIQGAAPVFFRILRDRNVRALFRTEIVSVSEQDGGYAVTFADDEGFHTLQAAAVLDTTSSGETLPFLEKPPFRKSLNATLVPEKVDEAPPSTEEPQFRLIPGSFPDEFYLRFFPDPGVSLYEARKALFSLWEKRSGGLRNWRIGAVSPEFSLRCEAETLRISDRRVWAPSAARRNLLAAFEAGLTLPLF